MKPSGVYALYALACITLVSCVVGPHQQVHCEQILEPRVVGIPFDHLAKTSAAEWIKASFPGGSYYGVGDGPDYSWSADGRGYTLVLGGGYAYLSASFSHQPSVGDVIVCFGSPSGYTIEKIVAEQPGARFTMWYPEKGIAFEYTGYGNNAYTRYDTNSLLSEIFITKPGTMTDVLSLSQSPSARQRIGTLLKPWPVPFTEVRLGNQ